ncbi:MAG: DUF5110 domain-containing protein, partial [Muribaculaceae bacterium]|nr:DUF5110 domain-containing protein [Muribaculaceae bacterium]
VRDAGVRVLKTDVAWVGAGYSFGLNGVADVAAIMPEYGRGARPFIISLDGWAGTQRYAGIWTGDQTGGDWEYIRFHIPTYIGSGLSGQPNITSDMDGIFGGRKPVMNTRDFQWKTFTPMQLNMDGWGSNPKYPHIFGGNYEKIVRAYLKLKSELMPYAYTYAREAVDGKPLMRAMFIDYPNDYTHGTATKYQFLYGPDLLVAPIYQETRIDEWDNDVRNGIYLPEGTWYDYFTGMPYVSDGNVVLNNYPAPLWKIPVFVKAGAIIPMVNPNNNPSEIDRNRRIYEIWPAEGKTTYTGYDDDGTTEGWKIGEYATTTVTSELSPKGVLTVKVDPTEGSYPGMPCPVYTTFRINVTDAPKSVTGFIGGKKLKLTKATTRYEFDGNDAAWYLDESPNRLGAWSIDESAAMHPQLLVKIPAVSADKTSVGVEVKGCRFNPAEAVPAMTAATAPSAPRLTVNPDEDILPYALNLRWAPMDDASSVEILHNGMLYTNCGTAKGETSLLFEDLTPTTTYNFKVRAVNPAGASDWTEIDLRTADNPLEFAIPGIKASSNVADQPGFGLWHAFDFDDRGDIWHSIYSGFDGPLDMTLDLGSFNTLDRLDYLPRLDAGNGTILGGSWQISENGTDWSEPQPFSWKRDTQTKTITFESHPLARFIRLHIDKTVGPFASAREFFVFKVPGTPSYLPGDINNDGQIDENDLPSYINYTGLRRGDGDFDYVSMGDVNRNGLLDAYDISVVATQLAGGIKNPADSIGGTITLAANKRTYNPGDEVRLTVKGTDLTGLNALSFALPYDPASYEYLGTEPLAVKGMENLTNDRLHTAGDKVLYPTFVNIGEKPVIEGSTDLFVIKFRAKVRGAFAPKASDIIMVDRALGSKTL